MPLETPAAVGEVSANIYSRYEILNTGFATAYDFLYLVAIYSVRDLEFVTEAEKIRGSAKLARE
jgi:hypothetical protein